jgi:hypothetical protein
MKRREETILETRTQQNQTKKRKNKKMGKAWQDKNAKKKKKKKHNDPPPFHTRQPAPVRSSKQQHPTRPDQTIPPTPPNTARHQSRFNPASAIASFIPSFRLSRALCIQQRSELGLSVLRLDMSNVDKQAGYRAQVSKLIAQGDSRDRDFFQCAARSFVIHSISHIPSFHQHHAVSFHRFLHKHFPRISNGIRFLPFIS